MPLSQNMMANFWYRDRAVNVFPANSKTKKPLVAWKEYQENRISEEQFEEWKSNNMFKDGMAVICGKVWGGQYRGWWLNVIDCDNKLGLDEVVNATKNEDIFELSRETLVEQHANKEKCHIYYLTATPMKSKAGNNDTDADGKPLPQIEIKSEGNKLIYCAGGIHKDGSLIEILESHKIKGVDVKQIEKDIETICNKYNISYLTKDNEVEKSKASKIKEQIKNKEYKKTIGSDRGGDLISSATSFKMLYPKASEQDVFLHNKGIASYHEKSSEYTDEAILQKTRVGIDYALENLAKSNTTLVPVDSEIFNLEKLNEIDNPKYANEKVTVNAVVASNSITYNVPTKIQAICCNGEKDHNCEKNLEVEIDESDYVSFVEIQEISRKKMLGYIGKSKFTKDCRLEIKEIESTTIRRLRLRPIISSLHKKDSKFFDDAGNEWSAYDVYVMQSTIQNLEAGKEVNVLGTVIADPKTGKVTILISEIKYLDENKFDDAKIEELVELFAANSIEENMNWLTNEFEKFSKIVKRKNVTETGLLTMFSPLFIEFEGKKVPSWIKSTIIGDSTTGKSETIRQLIILLKAGQIISGEMASVAGLAGASVQASGGQWFLDFGVLPLNDKKYLAIDGAHKLKKDEMDRLAEAERTGRIEINKAAKGEAYARTRQTKILNPLDEDGITTVTMDSFLFPVHSLKHSFQIQSIARIDLCCFVSDDVDVNDRNVKGGMAHDTRLDNLSDLVRLIWSKNYEIKFDDKTIDEILAQAIILENKFKSDEFPLITNDQKYKIAKLSASLACLLCSFGKDSPSEQKFGEIIVTEEHVKYISKLIDKEYCKAGLDEIAKQSRFGVINSDIIYEIVNGICVKTNDDDKANSIEILKWCATQSKITRDDLQEEFALSRDKQAQPLLTYLRNEKILKTSRNHYSITKKGVSVARFIANYSHEKMSDITRKNESSASSASSPSKTDTPTNNNNSLGGVSLLVDLERLEALKIKDFTCNDCNTTWNHTRLTLEEITKNHDKAHNIMESLQ